MGTTGQDLALKPLKTGPGRGLTGQTMVSALIAIGISTIGLLATTTLIQQSLKAGRSAEGLAASGLLTDTVRTVLAAKSGADCPRVFVPSSGTLTFPSAGSTVTLSRLEIPPPAGSPAGTAGTPLIAVNDKFSPTVKVTGLQLARRTDGFLELRISAEKTEGVKRLEVPTLLLAPTFDATTGALTACGYAAAGAGAGSGAGTGALAAPPDCQGSTKSLHFHAASSSWTCDDVATQGGTPCGGSGQGITMYWGGTRVCCYADYPGYGGSSIWYSKDLKCSAY